MTWIRIVVNQTLRSPKKFCVLPAIIMLHVLKHKTLNEVKSGWSKLMHLKYLLPEIQFKLLSQKDKKNNNINMTLSPPEGDSRNLTHQDGRVTSDRTRTRSCTQTMMVQFF